jgi:2-methylcitrate dehydratase PrpD
MEAERVTAADITAIRVHLPARSARTVDNAAMPDVNVQHLLAMLLIDGALTFQTIHDRARMSDPKVLALRRLITLVPSEELAQARPRRQAIVEVATHEGRTLSRRTIAVRGTADNPMTRAEVEAKALDLLAGAVGVRRAMALVRAVRDIGQLADVSALRRLWQPVSAP